jgi:hypothetical protein
MLNYLVKLLSFISKTIIRLLILFTNILKVSADTKLVK